VTFASSVTIDNDNMEIHSSVVAYIRSLDFWGKSDKVNMIIPEAWVSGQAMVLVTPMSRRISGFADPLFRLYVHLFATSPLSTKEFASHKQDIICASLALSPPGGLPTARFVYALRHGLRPLIFSALDKHYLVA
jgi:hypothetical protein